MLIDMKKKTPKNNERKEYLLLFFLFRLFLEILFSP